MKLTYKSVVYISKVIAYAFLNLHQLYNMLVLMIDQFQYYIVTVL